MLLLVGAELVLILALVPYFLFASFNSGNVDKYADAKNIPVVTADYGSLVFDSVRVSVPEKGASYAIGYDWAKNDKDYPSVPSSASAYYTDDSDNVLYEVMLYRDKVTPKDNNGNKYSLDMWFDEWTQGSKGSDSQKAYKTPDTKGFLIQTGSEAASSDEEASDAAQGETNDKEDKTPDETAEVAPDKAPEEELKETSDETSEENNTYCSYTYYFAVETDSDIEQYVLELDFYDPDYIAKAESIFKECADSISTGNSAHA